MKQIKILFGALCLSMMFVMPLSFAANAQEQEGCECVTCHLSGSQPVDGQYAYCGDKASVAAFAATLDKDGSKNGAICSIVKPAGECPKVQKPPAYNAAKLTCLDAASRNCSNTIAFDKNGLGCEARCCGEDGCVVPGLNIFSSFTPYHKLDVAAVPDAERDLYFAQKALHQKHVVQNKEPEYVGPVFCNVQGRGEPAAYNKCRNIDRITTIEYGDKKLELKTKSGPSAPSTSSLTHESLGQDGLRFVPYDAR